MLFGEVIAVACKVDTKPTEGRVLCSLLMLQHETQTATTSIPRANGNYGGRTESHEQLILHANWEQQTKESAVVDGTSCCVILECLMTPIGCIT